MALNLNKLLSTSPCFLPSLDEIGSVVLKGKIFFMVNAPNMFFTNLTSFPLEKVMTLHSIKLEMPSLKDALCQVWLNLLCGSGEKDI